MKKRFVFLLSMLLFLWFSFSPIPFVYGNDFQASYNPSTVTEIRKMSKIELALYKEAINQYDAIIVYDKLISSFIVQYGEKDGQPASYPENYAGSYINDDGKLVIQITSTDRANMTSTQVLDDYVARVDIIQLKKQVQEFKALNIKDVLILEQATYSLNDLNDMLVDVVSLASEEFPVASYYVDTLNNSVNVVIEQETYKLAVNTNELSRKIDLLSNRKIPLVIEYGKTSEPSANHMGGQGYYYHGSGGGATLGFTGWYNGVRAYLTCGHTSAYKAGDAAKYNGTVIGTVAAKSWIHNGNGDWGIVQLNSSETISGLVKQNSSGSIVGKIKARVNSVPVNTIVFRFGNTTKVWTTLKVSAVGVSKVWLDIPTSSSYTIKGLVRCTKTVGSSIQAGDSGGPFVIANGSNYSAVGTTTGESDGFAYYSPMSHVPSNFAVEIGY